MKYTLETIDGEHVILYKGEQIVARFSHNWKLEAIKACEALNEWSS